MNKQIHYFNYLRFYLMFFVVFGHALNNYDSQLFRTIYLFLYAFHMPVFVFVTGIFSKFNIKRVLQFLWFYIVLQTFQILLTIYIFKPNVDYSGIKLRDLILIPQWTLWFLIAYAVWMLITKPIKKVKVWHICVAVIVTLFIGYVEYVDRWMALSRIFYFLPFFLLGKMFYDNRQVLLDFLKKIQKPLTIVLSVLVLVCLFIVLYLKYPDVNKTYFYGNYSYLFRFKLLDRIISLSIGAIAGFSFMMLIPINITPKTNNIYSVNEIGKRTISIYILHTVILLLFNYYIQFAFNDILVVLILAVLSYILMIVTSFVPINNFINNPFGLIKKKVGNEK